MSRRRSQNPQRDLFEDQGRLFSEEEEELNDKARRFLGRMKQYRDREFVRLENRTTRQQYVSLPNESERRIQGRPGIWGHSRGFDSAG